MINARRLEPNRCAVFLPVFAAICFLIASDGSAQPRAQILCQKACAPVSENYAITAHVISAGGEQEASPGHLLHSFVSQPSPVGSVESSSYRIESGIASLFCEPFGPTVFHAGDHHFVRVSAFNPGPDIWVDAYVAVIFDGYLFSLPNFSTDPEPFYSGPLPSGFYFPPTVVLDIELWQGLPQTDYVWYIALCEPGTLNIISLGASSWSFE